MQATGHYKGSALAMGDRLAVGDYLVSPNGRFTGVMQRNGSFAIYWNRLGAKGSTPDTFEPGAGGCVWGTPLVGLFDLWTLLFQTNPNDPNSVRLNICPGGDPALTVWQSSFVPTKPGMTYSAVLTDSGEFQLLRTDGTIGWRTYCCLAPAQINGGSRPGGYWLLASKVKGTFVVSSNANGPWDATPTPTLTLPPPCTSVRPVQNLNPMQVSDDELWEVLAWIVDANNLIAGIVLLNKATGLALGSDSVGRTRLTREVNELCLWQQGGDIDGYYALRSVKDDSLHLNLAGDGPYAEGNPVILWDWKGAYDNLLWRFY